MCSKLCMRMPYDNWHASHDRQYLEAVHRVLEVLTVDEPERDQRDARDAHAQVVQVAETAPRVGRIPREHMIQRSLYFTLHYRVGRVPRRDGRRGSTHVWFPSALDRNAARRQCGAASTVSGGIGTPRERRHNTSTRTQGCRHVVAGASHAPHTRSRARERRRVSTGGREQERKKRVMGRTNGARRRTRTCSAAPRRARPWRAPCRSARRIYEMTRSHEEYGGLNHVEVTT